MRPRLVLTLAMPASFVAGHVVGFAVDHHDDAARATVQEGHGYLSSLGTLAVPLLVASVLLAFVAGARRQAFRPRYGATMTQFVAVFAVIELVEHLRAGWTLTHVLAEPALWFGVVTQLVLAAVVVTALRWSVRAGERLADRRERLTADRSRPVVTPVAVVRAALAWTPICRRGPPLPLAP
jgi:hypothetical protein